MVVTKLPDQRAADTGDRHDWWRWAACQEADPELFFPVAPVGPGAGEIAQAKALCAACGVRRQCLQYALATHQVHGVWGGMTEAERLVHARREREHRERERGQRPRRDPVRPERGEPVGSGTRARVARIRSV
jgi:WhiB family transcriptional regulator, redox-sensing transcriptional regulator